MKLTYRDIEGFLRKPPERVRAVLVYGPDDGLVRERAAMLGKTVLDDLKDPFRVAELSLAELLEDPARLSDEANAMAMTGGRRLVRLRDAGDKAAPVCQSFLDNPGDGDSLIVLEAGDLGPRSALRKLFEKQDNAAALPCYVEDERDLARLIGDTCRQHGFGIGPDAIAYLSSALVGDRMMARSELEKLMLYVGAYDEGAEKTAGRQVTLEDAVACVGNNAAISLDDIAMNTAGGNDAAMDRVLNTMFDEGIPPVAILRAVQNHFRRLHLTRARMEKGETIDAAMKKLQPPVFFKMKNAFTGQLNRWPLDHLTMALEKLSEAEALCKKTGYPDRTLCARTLFALAQMARRAGKRRAA